MSKRQDELLKKLNIDKESFETNNGITLDDVVEMVSALTEIVIGGME